MKTNSRQLITLPNKPGVYLFKDKKDKILYIGKAANLASRIKSYFSKTGRDAKFDQLIKQLAKIETIPTDSEIEALLLEAEMVKRYAPKFNIRLKDDKSFLSLGISITEDYPRIFYARRPDLTDKKNLYFGPFTSADNLRKAMRALRRIFPFRTCRKIPHRPCLWYQMYKLPAPCDQSINKKDYRKIIRQLIEFCKGRKKKLISQFEKEIKKKVKEKNFEQAVVLRDKIFALRHLNEVFLTSGEIEKAQIPKRIECYDISNIFGKEATGSMIVFTRGEPDKSQYRRFKIKTVKGISDLAMLDEVLRRRLNHSKLEKLREKDFWPLPNLIIIDGGIGQLNVARRAVLEEANLNIPIIAIAKGPSRRGEKLFYAGKKVLTDLNLIKRIRDEAHRFAISYHKILRRKKTFE